MQSVKKQNTRKAPKIENKSEEEGSGTPKKITATDRRPQAEQLEKLRDLIKKEEFEEHFLQIALREENPADNNSSDVPEEDKFVGNKIISSKLCEQLFIKKVTLITNHHFFDILLFKFNVLSSLSYNFEVIK